MSEHIEIHGFGDVILTAHIVEQYADRFGKKLIGDAWRYLKKVAAEEKIIEIDKNNKATRMKYALKGREVGRYFYHTTKDVMLVVAKNAEGYPSLVTAYKIDYKL